jgi:hypothetical protein
MQGGYWYSQTAQPQFQTAEYDFWNFSPVPGMTNFVNGQPGDLLIAPVGGSIGVNGYAKLAVVNAYSGVFGYLGQYFDQAYQIDTNGNVTTNTTGLLSPYGQFFATEPGPAALVTMPDIDTGERGTGVVWCASMQVDKNADGIMDLSFSGTDATSVASPMRAWVNNGLIVPGINGNLDHDVPTGTSGPYNYTAGQITCQRDLENFFRLWVCGVPSLPASQGYSVTLSCAAISGSPAINLYLAETNGGTLYLTDTNAAQNLVGETMLGSISPTSIYTFPDNFFDGTNKHFLFEGAGIGEGQFTLTVWRGTNAIAQTSTYIDLHDIKDLYEQAHIAGVPTTFPDMVNTTNASSFVSDHEVAPNTDKTKQLIVFVHGWRMGVFDYQDFSDTMFKRLYWQGYKGRFASLRWPTLSADDFRLFSDLQSQLTYNRSEYIAFRSAQGASDYFDWLKSRFPGYSINVAAHSMGNILMMETLKLQLAQGSQNIDNYVLMQGAVPAHCYDANAPLQPSLVSEESEQPTPNTYLLYPGAINNAINGAMVNFFNANDFALNFWINNESLYKPDGSSGYYIVPPLQPYRLLNTPITDPREIMAFVARPRSFAVGAQPDVQGVISEQGQVDLAAQFGFGRESWDHSGEFNRSIQQMASFYRTLLNTLFPPE